MRAFIVVMEYTGETLGAGEGAPRVPVREHAYDLQTAALAGHRAGPLPRVGFPTCQRGWNSQPTITRCLDCDTIVQGIVCDLVAAAVAEIVHRY